MRPPELLEIALVLGQPIESAGARADAGRAPWPLARDLVHRTIAPYVRRATREAQAAQASAAVETSLALCVLATAACAARYRRGVRACHISAQLEVWGAWGPWLGRRSAKGVGEFLRRNVGRPCGADGPCRGWGVVRLDDVDTKRRYAIRYLS